jgi:hypothetical protein
MIIGQKAGMGVIELNKQDARNLHVGWAHMQYVDKYWSQGSGKGVGPAGHSGLLYSCIKSL